MEFGQINQKLFFLLYSFAHRNSVLDVFWIFLAKYCIFIFGLILVYLLFKDRKLSLKIILTLAISIIIVELIKKSLFFPRPFLQENIKLLIAHQSDSTFPSKHTTVAFAVAFGVFLKKKKIGIWLLVLAFLIAISRIVVGVHYPLDIAGGILIAVSVVYLNDKIIHLPT